MPTAFFDQFSVAGLQFQMILDTVSRVSSMACQRLASLPADYASAAIARCWRHPRLRVGADVARGCEFLPLRS